MIVDSIIIVGLGVYAVIKMIAGVFEVSALDSDATDNKDTTGNKDVLKLPYFYKCPNCLGQNEVKIYGLDCDYHTDYIVVECEYCGMKHNVNNLQKYKEKKHRR